MTKLKTRKNNKRRARPSLPQQKSRQVSGAVIELGGGFGTNVRLANTQVDAVASKVNNALTSGKLVKFGNEWVNPKNVVSIGRSTWTEYIR